MPYPLSDKMANALGVMPHPTKRRWGHLTLTEVWSESITADGPNGPYDTGERDTYWRLLCDCGREMVIRYRDFPGRRNMKRCDLPDCPFRLGKRYRPKLAEPRVIMTVSAPISLATVIRSYAEENKLTMSRAMMNLLRLGLEKITIAA